jgi:hypothetical protein
MQLPARGQLFISLAILIAGWGVVFAIYFSATDDDQLPFELTDASKLYVRRIEELGGKSAVLYQEMGDFLGSLWHGSRLGLTIGVLSSLFAVAWFLLAPRE